MDELTYNQVEFQPSDHQQWNNFKRLKFKFRPEEKMVEHLGKLQDSRSVPVRY